MKFCCPCACADDTQHIHIGIREKMPRVLMSGVTYTVSIVCDGEL